MVLDTFNDDAVVRQRHALRFAAAAGAVDGAIGLVQSRRRSADCKAWQARDVTAPDNGHVVRRCMLNGNNEIAFVGFVEGGGINVAVAIKVTRDARCACDLREGRAPRQYIDARPLSPLVDAWAETKRLQTRSATDA
jgi:hypothetical protein